MMKKKPTPLSPVTPHADREEALADYVLAHISPEDEYLHRLYRATQTQLLYPRMASSTHNGFCVVAALSKYTNGLSYTVLDKIGKSALT